MRGSTVRWVVVLALLASLWFCPSSVAAVEEAAATAVSVPPQSTGAGAGKRNLEDYRAIHAFFDQMQAPGNCTTANGSDCGGCAGLEYVWSDMGCGGGFAAHFQLAASQWLRAAALTDYKVPILIIGQIWKYSEGAECKHVGGDWTCFFEKMAPCQNKLTKVGKVVAVDVNKAGPFDERLIPEQFRHVGIAYWWGIVQERMFRMQPDVQKYVEAEAAHWFPGLTAESLQPGYLLQPGLAAAEAAPVRIAGIHVRHGDKKSDGFKHQSLEAQLTAVQYSKDCHQSTTAAAVEGGSEGGGVVRRGPVSCVGASGKPLEIYVASDDAAVLASAAAMGHLVDRDGVSQTTHDKGMLSALWNDVGMGYNATLEIIRDITLLSRCSSVVGIAASQVFRMAVGLSNATGTLQGSVFAMDHSQLGRVASMSSKFKIPLVEHFEQPLQ